MKRARYYISVGLPGAPGRREDVVVARPRSREGALKRGREISGATRVDELTWVWEMSPTSLGWHTIGTFKSGREWRHHGE